ncbi:MAG: hypothetical protein A2516_08365 [Alphaproteobacteria bacterium RIFOXYD12_FULL_60_8]|nr:MAG: hypothetical protein A2516_08365 [Alphaproteobacteria bacterium RIFOXYD12_FULL_60_8]
MAVRIRKPPQGPGLRRINMKIGEAERRSGIMASAVRYWEEQGLLTPRRSRKGTRLYSEADLSRLATLRALTEAGVSLEELHVLFRAPSVSGTGDEAAHKTVYHLTRLVARLTAKRDALSRILEGLGSAESHARQCFRCKQRPGPETCQDCPLAAPGPSPVLA